MLPRTESMGGADLVDSQVLILPVPLLARHSMKPTILEASPEASNSRGTAHSDVHMAPTFAGESGGLSTVHPGATIGAFRLGPLLGRGGMASVYRATHLEDDTPVALKVLHPGVAKDALQLEGFAFEVRAAASLNHPRITAIYDHGLTTSNDADASDAPGGLPWLAMELVEGGTLQAERGRLSWPDLQRSLLDVLDALAHAHARGLVHRDIKPGNVLLDARTRRPKLTDFGLVLSSKDIEAASGRGSAVTGTPAYMAPEQIRGEPRGFGPWTDLYAVGVMAWGLACGANPFQETLPAVFQQHLTEPLPAFRPLQPMPASLIGWIEAMTAIHPRDRFQRAADAAAALRALSVDPMLAPADPHGELFAVGFDDLDAETRTLDPAAVGELLDPWVEHDDDDSHRAEDSDALPPIHRRTGPFELAQVRSAFPTDWRTAHRARVHLHGAGLALFSLRTSGVAGRGQVQDELWSTLGGVIEDRARRFVLLEGAAGSGKTTLAKWLGFRAEELGQARWLCIDPIETATDGDGIATFLARLLRIDGLERAAAISSVRDRLGRLGLFDAEDAAALVQLAMPVREAEAGDGLTVHFGTERERWMLLSRLLSAMAEQRPLVLCLDALHRDTASLSFAEHLLTELPDAPILIVGTVASEEVPRDTPLATRLNTMTTHRDARRIELPPLGSSGMISLVQDLLGLDIALATTLEQRCSGNPQFAVQLVSSWVERGLLAPSTTGFRLREGADNEIPSNMLSLWQQRLESVLAGRPPSEVWAIEVAATLGAEVHRTEWEDVLRLVDVELSSSLMAELQRRRLILSSADQQRWSFANGLFRAAVLAHAERGGRRVRWASAAVDVLPEAGPFVARRAQLLMAAGRTEEALAPLTAAIMEQTRRAEYGRADQLFELRQAVVRDFNIDSSSVHALATEVCRHFLQRPIDRTTPIRRDGPRLIAWAEQCKAWELLASLELDLGMRLPSWEDGRIHVERSLALARTHRLSLIGYILNMLSYREYDAQRYTEAAAYARAAIYEAERQGDILLVAHAYENLGTASLNEGRFAEAQFFITEAQDRYEHMGSRSGLASIYHVKARLEHAQNNMMAAEQAYLQAEVRYRSCGSSNHLYAALNIALIRCEGRRFPEARTQFEQLAKQVANRPAHALSVWVRLGLTTCMAYDAEWEALDAELEDLAELLRKRSLYEHGAVGVGVLCTELCLEADQPSVAHRAWALVEEQLTVLGFTDTDAETELTRRIEALRVWKLQRNEQHANGQEVSSIRS